MSACGALPTQVSLLGPRGSPTPLGAGFIGLYPVYVGCVRDESHLGVVMYQVRAPCRAGFLGYRWSVGYRWGSTFTELVRCCGPFG